MGKRYVLEGEWTGYSSSQQRVVHREVIGAKRAEVFKLTTILYTDGTRLLLRARPCEPRERVQTIQGYTSLIWQAERTGKTFVRVADLEDEAA